MKWDKEADVVVLGFGNAGSNAAIAAADGGASVLILEKMHEGGGSVCVSSGGFVVSTNRDDYYTYQKALYEFSNTEYDEELLKVFCDESMKLGEYVNSLDPQVSLEAYGHAGYQNLPGADSVDKISPRNVPGKKGGERFFGIFSRAVESRKIPVLLNTTAKQLIRRNNEVGSTRRSRRQTASHQGQQGRYHRDLRLPVQSRADEALHFRQPDGISGRTLAYWRRPPDGPNPWAPRCGT